MTPEARLRVVTETLEWMGTPYHHHGRVKGVGVDCAMFLAEVYERAGVVPHVETGHYPTDWHLHHSEERFIGWLKQYGRPLGEGECPRVGDAAIFRYGRAFSHGGIMLNPITCIHSYVKLGVIQTRLDEEPLVGRAVIFWSIG